MNIKEERRKAEETIEAYEKICEKLPDGMTYDQYAEEFGAAHVVTVLNARDRLIFLDKVEKMKDDELKRISDIPAYRDDMREVKDIKDKYGFTWTEVRDLRAGVTREDEDIQGQGTAIKKALKEAGLTQTAYSESRGIPIRTLQNWISEKTVLSDWLLGFVLKDLADIAKKR